MKAYSNARDITHVPVMYIEEMWDILMNEIGEAIEDDYGPEPDIKHAEFDFVSDAEIHRYCLRARVVVDS